MTPSLAFINKSNMIRSKTFVLNANKMIHFKNLGHIYRNHGIRFRTYFQSIANKNDNKTMHSKTSMGICNNTTNKLLHSKTFTSLHCNKNSQQSIINNTTNKMMHSKTPFHHSSRHQNICNNTTNKMMHSRTPFHHPSRQQNICDSTTNKLMHSKIPFHHPSQKQSICNNTTNKLMHSKTSFLPLSHQQSIINKNNNKLMHSKTPFHHPSQKQNICNNTTNRMWHSKTFIPLLHCNKNVPQSIVNNTTNKMMHSKTSPDVQLTLAVLKPDVASLPPAAAAVRQDIVDAGLKVLASRSNVRVRRADAERFYQEHQGKFFFNRLVSFMSSGPIECHVLAGADAVAKWRAVMGPTKVFKTRYEQPTTVRGRFGVTDTRNAAHGSDSDDTARREIGFFFPEFDYSAALSALRRIDLATDLTFDPAAFKHSIVVGQNKSGGDES